MTIITIASICAGLIVKLPIEKSTLFSLSDGISTAVNFANAMATAAIVPV